MSKDTQTGPWALALGTLAIGVGAVTAKVLRKQRTDSDDQDQRGDAT